MNTDTITITEIPLGANTLIPRQPIVLKVVPDTICGIEHKDWLMVRDDDWDMCPCGPDVAAVKAGVLEEISYHWREVVENKDGMALNPRQEKLKQFYLRNLFLKHPIAYVFTFSELERLIKTACQMQLKTCVDMIGCVPGQVLPDIDREHIVQNAPCPDVAEVIKKFEEGKKDEN